MVTDMKYDFTTVIDRTGTGSKKWNAMYMEKPDVAEGTVPMSTADMEFANAPEIREGLSKYASKAVYGYTEATQEYTEAVVNWMKKRHDFEIEGEWIVQTAGVIPGLAAMVQAYTKPGEGVIIMPPVYFPFKYVTELSGRKLVENPLKLTESGYEIDFDDLERKAADADTKLLIFCSPHNPVGRVWTKDELSRLMDICIRNDIFILDDEIHNDLIMPGYKHTVLATVSEEAKQHCAVCTAPSKSFNLAGMQTSNIIIANSEKRKALMYEKLKSFSLDLNIFGYEACRLAYTKGEAWLDECIEVINENARFVERFMAENLPEVKVYPLQGTYLLWVDFRALGMNYEELKELMVKEADIFLDEGYMFGEAGRGFERFNIACPAAVVKAAMNRILAAVNRRKKLCTDI